MKQDEAKKKLVSELVKIPVILASGIATGFINKRNPDSWKYSLILSEVLGVLWNDLANPREDLDVSDDVTSLISRCEKLRIEVYRQFDEQDLDDMNENVFSLQYEVPAEKLISIFSFCDPEKPKPIDKDAYWEMMKKEHGWE